MKLTDKDREKLIGRVKKLLALGAKHEDTPEGSSALAKAKQIMADNNLRFIDVEDGEVKDSNIGKEEVGWHKFRNNTEQILGAKISQALDCEYVLRNKGSKFASHCFIGTHTDIELATWLFKYVRLQSYKLAEQTNFTGPDLRTYFMSMYFAVGDKIEDLYSKPEEEELSDCTALIVVKKDAVARKKAEYFPKLKSGRRMKTGNGNMEAVIRGRIDGESIRLNKQVDGSSSTGKLN